MNESNPKKFNVDIVHIHAKNIVTDGCFSKIYTESYFKYALIKTGYRPIIDASPYDKIWDEQNDKNIPIDKWQLGECLMRTREKLGK